MFVIFLVVDFIFFIIHLLISGLHRNLSDRTLKKLEARYLKREILTKNDKFYFTKQMAGMIV
ncbi:hypothetical protein G159_02440 [Planococcus glaciei CHR43]|nr:hypothetical protein G159_02440 [Planococcus glaciei CHR43]